MGEATSESFIINVLTFDLMKILFCTLFTRLGPPRRLGGTARGRESVFFGNAQTRIESSRSSRERVNRFFIAAARQTFSQLTEACYITGNALDLFSRLRFWRVDARGSLSLCVKSSVC